jgi:hypothetical protein
MKKFIFFISIILGVWIYNNPIEKIGISKPNFIDYSGFPSSVPILFHYKALLPSYQDKLIDKNGELRLNDAINQTLIDRLGTIGGFEYVVIGLGYGNNLYTISDRLANRISSYTVFTGSTPKMVKKYNKLKSDGKKVLGIMVPNIKTKKFNY